MTTLRLLVIFAQELVCRTALPRQPEPDLVMEDEHNVAAYADAGGSGGVMSPTHLYHTSQVCSVIRPGDLVLDLGCGPGSQLIQVASLNPQTRFIGIDLSDPMLRLAAESAAAAGLTNVEWLNCDMTSLKPFATASIAAVMSSMTLHHLPTLPMLGQCLGEVARILKPGGGLYLADFCRLKRMNSMRKFAQNHAARQSPAFTEDYFNSLRAAFSAREFRGVLDPLSRAGTLHVMKPLPFMLAIMSRPRRSLSELPTVRLAQLADALPDAQKSDLRSIRQSFALGGLAPCF